MSTKATKTTPHYNLSQWEPEDHILRSDFNADNAIIDAALASKASITAVAAAEEKIAVVRLASVRLSEGASSIEVDLSQVDLSQYQRLELAACGYKLELLLRFNGDSGANYHRSGDEEAETSFRFSGTYAVRNSTVSVGHLMCGGGALQYSAPLTAHGGSAARCGHYPPVTDLTELNSIQLSGILEPGFCFAVYGYRG